MSTTRTAGSVVVGVDFSKPNATAVEYAAAVASRRHLPLLLTYALNPHEAPATYLALNPEELRADAEEELADQKASLSEDFPGLDIHTVVLDDTPVHTERFHGLRAGG